MDADREASGKLHVADLLYGAEWLTQRAYLVPNIGRQNPRSDHEKDGFRAAYGPTRRCDEADMILRHNPPYQSPGLPPHPTSSSPSQF